MDVLEQECPHVDVSSNLHTEGRRTSHPSGVLSGQRRTYRAEPAGHAAASA